MQHMTTCARAWSMFLLLSDKSSNSTWTYHHYDDYEITIMIFSTVLKRFCPGDSKNVFVLVLAHLELELELFEVWEIMVPQIIITIITNVINFKQLLLGF